MTKYIDQLFQEAYECLAPTEHQGFVDWARIHFKLSKGATQATNDEYDFDPHPWQIGVMHCVANLDIAKFWFVKGAQIGWSQILKAFIAYELAHRGRGTALWMPRDKDKSRYRSVQIKTLLEDCQAIAASMLGEVGKKSETNKTDLIMFKLATFFLSSAQSPANFRDINCATALLDEFSAIPRYVGKEGSPDSNAFARTDGSESPILRIGSTPLTADDCQISEAVNEIFHQFWREIPCARCGWLQELEFGGKDAKYGLKFEKIYYEGSDQVDKQATAETVQYQCIKCHGHFTHDEYKLNDRHGIWVSDRLAINDGDGEFFNRETGEWLRAPWEMSMRASQFLSHKKPWSRQITAWLSATEKLKTKDDSSGVIQFVQEAEGRAYQNKETIELVTWEQYRDRRCQDYIANYGAECPLQVQYITGHIDLHPNFAVLEVRGWGYGFESWSLDYYHVTGDFLVRSLEELKENEKWQQLIEYSEKRYPRPDGSRLTLSVCGVDAGWEPIIAKQLQDFDRAFFIPTLGARNEKNNAPLCTPPSKNPNKIGLYPMYVGTFAAKDYLAKRASLEKPGKGWVHYPDCDAMKDKHEYDDDFFKGIFAEKKITKWNEGKPKEAWVHRSKSIRNEPLDCHTNNLALMEFLVVKRGATLIPYVEPDPAELSSAGQGKVSRSVKGVSTRGLSAREIWERNQNGA